MKGTIPPGVSVPMHSHPEIDAFFVLSGMLRCLATRVERLIGSRSVLVISRAFGIIDPQGAQRCCESRSTIYRWPPCTGDANPVSRSLGGGRLK